MTEVKGRLSESYLPPVPRLRTSKSISLAGVPVELAQRKAFAYRQICVLKARVDFGAFMEFCFIDPVTREPFVQQWFHDEWSVAEETSGQLLIIAPRSHGKTSQIIGKVLFLLGHNPNLRIKIVCASDPRAMERLFEIRQHLETNGRIREVFPDLAPDQNAEWSKHRLIMRRDMRMKDASVEAVGITSSITGGRADVIIADDVVDRRNGFSKAGRDEVKKAWFSDWSNLLEPTGKVIAICTLWHKEDLNHSLMENGEYTVMKYQIDDGFGSIWPEKWSEQRLRRRHREIGSVEFNRAFRNQAVDFESSMVRSSWLKYSDLKTNELFMAASDNLVYFTSYDTADTPTGGTDQDYTANCTLAADPASNKIYVIDAWHSRMTLKEQADKVFEEWLRYSPFRVLVEKAGLSTLAEWAIEAHPELSGHIEIIRPRVSKTIRLLEVTPMLENEQVVFSHHLNPDSENYNPGRGSLPGELLDFPFGKHDDMVDAFVHALKYVRMFLAQYGVAKQPLEGFKPLAGVTGKKYKI